MMQGYPENSQVRPPTAVPPKDVDPSVLVVCGDLQVGLEICDLLRLEGFEARGVQTAAEAEAALRIMRAELIILDGRFGEGGAMAVCRRLAVGNAASIIMISDQADVTERVIALEVGADDLLSRPFNSRELLARARALIRRSRALLKPEVSGRAGTVVRGPEREPSLRGSWDNVKRRLTGPTGEPVALTSAEAALLDAFLEHPGRPVAMEDIVEGIGEMSPNYFRTTIVRVRRKIMKAGFPANMIRTVRKGGYYFDMAVPVPGADHRSAVPATLPQQQRDQPPF